WLQTLRYIFGGDEELVGFLQRYIGYCLTGVTTEQKLVFEHGTGANGKGLTTGTMAGVLGDYAITAPMEAFTVSKSDRHPTDLAMLRGARLVTASETEDGRAWGRVPDQADDGRRQDRGQVHETGLLRVRAPVQAPDLGQPQAVVPRS